MDGLVTVATFLQRSCNDGSILWLPAVRGFSTSVKSETEPDFITFTTRIFRLFLLLRIKNKSQ